jgi:adenine-specific DNA-methyltransferase
MRLLAHDDISYEWVDPSDWRVSEVRLLHPSGTEGKPPKTGNLLIQGDALHALTALTSLPSLKGDYVGKVKLCYIDPPFNTGQTFQHYDDAVEHSVWLTMLRDRLVQIKRLLAPNGSVWVHLDDAEQHRARSVLDEVFGADNFVATVIWERTDLPQMQADYFSAKHDYILVYRSGDAFVANRTSSSEIPLHYNLQAPDGRRYFTRTLRQTGPGSARADRPTMWYPMIAPDGTEVWPIRDDGSEGRWRWGPARYKRDKNQIDWQSPRGRGWDPHTRTYWPGETKRPPETIWPYAEVGSNRTAKLEIRALFPGVDAFATPKPERLMERVIQIASDAGDLVLDCFAGSGTTAAVAHKMGRRWLTVELSEENTTKYVRPRLQKVVAGTDRGGISENVDTSPVEDLPEGVSLEMMRDCLAALEALDEASAFDDERSVTPAAVKSIEKVVKRYGRSKKQVDAVWTGGSGFRELIVGPSMFEDVEGTIVLADWVTGGELAEAVAAQLGYALEIDGPFSGRKGRSRLAVLDGMLTQGVAEHLIDKIGEKETLVIVAQALEPGVEDYVRTQRPGSRARKVPRDLAKVGRLQSHLVRLGEPSTEDGDE